MKIHEPVLLAKSLRLLVRFMISGKTKRRSPSGLRIGAAAIQPLAEIAEVARGDVNVRGLRDHAFQRAQVAMDIAED